MVLFFVFDLKRFFKLYSWGKVVLFHSHCEVVLWLKSYHDFLFYIPVSYLLILPIRFLFLIRKGIFVLLSLTDCSFTFRIDVEPNCCHGAKKSRSGFSLHMSRVFLSFLSMESSGSIFLDFYIVWFYIFYSLILHLLLIITQYWSTCYILVDSLKFFFYIPIATQQFPLLRPFVIFF